MARYDYFEYDDDGDDDYDESGACDDDVPLYDCARSKRKKKRGVKHQKLKRRVARKTGCTTFSKFGRFSFLRLQLGIAKRTRKNKKESK